MADVAIRRRRMPRYLNLRYQPGFGTLAILCLVMLYAPIVVLIIFSFNENRSVAVWTEFSFDWYRAAFQNEGIRDATWVSLKLAGVATVVSTVIATAAALATTRTRAYRGMTAVYLVINQPLVVPEIVTAVATLSFFALLRTELGIYFGFGNLIIAHTVFCIPFAYMPIRARLEDMDLTLEQAAADLYATPWQTFKRVTLPLLIPGIVAGAMLAFIVSFDDVIITAFVAGPGETTLPIFIFGAIRRGVTPEINAISTIVLAVSVLFVTLFYFISRRSR
ncbi:MAG: ABC transporter permease [Rhodospirillaceae bacterium]|nr:ABC transporter permease [Rhodospirillaceae bacterium]